MKDTRCELYWVEHSRQMEQAKYAIHDAFPEVTSDTTGTFSSSQIQLPAILSESPLQPKQLLLRHLFYVRKNTQTR